jgi:hypothetical protein
MVYNSIKCAEAGTGIPLSKIHKRITKETGVLERTPYCIMKEGKAGAYAEFTSPSKNRKDTRYEVQGFNKGIVWRTVYNFTIADQEMLTVQKIQSKVCESTSFIGGHTTLHRLL